MTEEIKKLWASEKFAGSKHGTDAQKATLDELGDICETEEEKEQIVNSIYLRRKKAEEVAAKKAARRGGWK